MSQIIYYIINNMNKLRAHQNFLGFTLEELNKLIKVCTEKKVNKNEIVFRENETGNSLYMVADGNVKISKLGYLGEVILTHANPGEIIGEMALINGSVRSATAIAITDSVLFELNRSSLEFLKNEYPTVAIKFLEILLKILSERLFQTTRKILRK